MDRKEQILMWAGIALILATGGIHVIDGPDAFSEAAYKGWLFYANGAAALLAAVGIITRQRWAWPLGFAVALGSIVGYVLSRTIGLPGIPAEPEAWFEPLGVASIIAEAGYLAVMKISGNCFLCGMLKNKNADGKGSCRS